MDSLRLALAQVEGSADTERNLETARTCCQRVARAGARLIVFPEMFMALPRKGESLASVAEPLDGPFACALAGEAKAHGLYLLAGLWEQAPRKDRVHNTAALFSPDGRRIARYRKMHLFDALSVRESDRMLAGDEPPEIVEIDGFKTGFAICYDLRFPELFRRLAAEGAHLMLVPAAWYAGPLKEDHWLTLLKARAIENTCYVGGAVLCGPPFTGRSTVVDPLGVSLCDAGESPGIVLADIHARRLEEVRTKLPCLRHRRRDLAR